MANELTLSASLSFTKATTHVNSRNMGLDAVTVTVTGTDCIGPVTQTVGTSVEALELGDITTPGYIVIRNIASDPSYYVNIRNGSSGANVVTLRDGEIALFRLAATQPYVIATGGNCQLLYALIED